MAKREMIEMLNTRKKHGRDRIGNRFAQRLSHAAKEVIKIICQI